ncbi:class I SAM-dependent methyltransferase [Amycolatopsis sp. NPDC051106]|uniref:class I SAM-dependent methyltransferase n=1 Tax=unclassified Amycolatopsis TaxID=2618356 RepID=UPI00341F96A9
MQLEKRLRQLVKRYAVARKSYDDLEVRESRLTARLDQLSARYDSLMNHHDELLARHAEVVEEKQAFEEQYRTWVPPGHFYSPFASKEEIGHRAASMFDIDARPPAIDLREAEQIELFGALADLAGDLPFTAERSQEHRYFYENTAYSWSDAIILHTMLRHLRPKRMIEVGSGYSTAMTLDTADGWLPELELTCVEPYPQLLESLFRPGDEDRVRVLGQAVQDVPLDTFAQLQAGDVLFIDSTHVVKAGSDVNYLFFEVLPRLNDGVWVHVHDVFFPFEYPMDWLVEGRAWQEDYLLRAFLMYNRRFEIRWYQQFMWAHHRDLLEGRVPELAGNSGGNIWLQKVPE